MNKLFIMIGNGDHDAPSEYGMIMASNVKEAIAKSVNPETAEMYIPCHMQNQDGYGEEADDVIKEKAISDAIKYFGIDEEKPDRYDRTFTLLEIDLDTKKIKEY